MKPTESHGRTMELLRQLCLPTIRESFLSKAAEALTEQLSYEEYLRGSCLSLSVPGGTTEALSVVSWSSTCPASAWSRPPTCTPRRLPRENAARQTRARWPLGRPLRPCRGRGRGRSPPYRHYQGVPVA